MKVKVAQLCPTLCDPTGYTVHGILQARTLEWVAFPSPEDLPNPGIKPRSPTFQADSLPAKPQGKPKNTGVGSLSLLQWLFPTQESNWGLLHCRRILYQLSSQARPFRGNGGLVSLEQVRPLLSWKVFYRTRSSPSAIPKSQARGTRAVAPKL